MPKKEMAACEFSLNVRCSKLIVEPPKGESISPTLSAELIETVEKSPAKIAIKDIDETIAEVLRAGILKGRRYELYVQLKELPEVQTSMNFDSASGAH
jgi:Zn-finger domain-containing protein